MWMVYFKIMVDMLLTFLFKSSFSLLNKDKRTTFNFVNDVTVISNDVTIISICENVTFVEF